MIMPEDWREYDYEVSGGPVVAPFLIKQLERRLWRLHITAGGVAVDVVVNGFTVTVAANTTVVLEPKGMIPVVITGVANVPSLIIESIARINPVP